MSKANYKYVTLPHFSLNAFESNRELCQRPVSTIAAIWQSVVGAENVGGCKLFLSSLSLAKKN